jgi:phosphohistidine phosphatase
LSDDRAATTPNSGLLSPRTLTISDNPSIPGGVTTVACTALRLTRERAKIQRVTRHSPHATPMNLLVIRHAIAEDKDAFAATGRGDDQRPLTEAGRAKMRRAAAGLRLVAPRVMTLASSPLVRARETAEIVAPALEMARVEIVDALRPDRPFSAFLEWLRPRAVPNDDADRTIAVVGHEPHLSGLVTWLMTASNESRIELKKGAACLLQFERTPSEGAATLRWALTPSQLRMLGD